MSPRQGGICKGNVLYHLEARYALGFRSESIVCLMNSTQVRKKFVDSCGRGFGEPHLPGPLANVIPSMAMTINIDQQQGQRRQQTARYGLALNLKKAVTKVFRVNSLPIDTALSDLCQQRPPPIIDRCCRTSFGPCQPVNDEQTLKNRLKGCESQRYLP